MKNLLVFLFLFFISASSTQAQTINNVSVTSKEVMVAVSLFTQLFGEPRTQLKTSFYSDDMHQYDWHRKGEKKEYTLFGLENKVKTNGKTIVYDASVTSITDIPVVGANNFTFNVDNVVVNTTNKTLQIPIKYLGDNSIGNNLTQGEKSLVSDYVNKSLAFSGVTPSKINITSKNGDFDITILKSDFTNEDIIVEGYNLRSRTEKKDLLANVNQLIDNADLDEAKAKLEIAIRKYPEMSEFISLLEKCETLKQVKAINNKNNGIAIRLIEEGINIFTIFDGLRPKSEGDIQNKSAFADDLINSISEDVTVVYLDVTGLTEEKAAGLISSTRIQVKAKRPNLKILEVPKDESDRDVFFEGKVLSKDKESQIVFEGDNSATQTYNVEAKGKTYKIWLRFKVNSSIIQSKSKKLITSFFQFFDKIISKKDTWNLIDAVNKAKKDMEKKNKDINSDDYDCDFKQEFGDINIVFIEEIKEENTPIIKNE